MKLRTALVLALPAFSIGFCPSARADNTYVVKIQPDLSLQTSGKACRNGTIRVENHSGGAVDVTVTEGDGTVIFTATIANGGKKSGKINKLGTPLVCTAVPSSGFRACD